MNNSDKNSDCINIDNLNDKDIKNDFRNELCDSMMQYINSIDYNNHV